MLRGIDDCNQDLINEVCNYYASSHDMNLLRERYSNIDYSLLCSILYSSHRFDTKIYSCLCQESIDEDKMIIISDTHYGSKYENMKYTYDMFNYAVANGIHVILHGGDIIESECKKIKGTNGNSQANFFINKYPHDDSIKTYALLGNHDYMAICLDEEVRDILESREDIDILGYKKAYLEWLGNKISIRHNIEKYRLNLPMYYTDYLAFRGHSHFYHVGAKRLGKSEVINIPSMCDEPFKYRINPDSKSLIKSIPGFLVASIKDEIIYVNFYAFVSGKIVWRDEFTKTLKKKRSS